MLQTIKNNKYLLLAFIFIVFYSFWNNQYYLGNWESFTLFHFLAPEKISYFFDISKRANIGGLGFFPLEIARSVMDTFGWSLTTMRFPSILMGIAVSVGFYFYLKRFLDQIPALCAALIFFTNPYFQVFQHQSNILIISFGLSFFFCLTAEKISEERKLRWFVILALCGVALSLYYAFGRYIGAMVLLGLFMQSLYLLKKKQVTLQNELANWSTFFAIYFGIHAMNGVKNLMLSFSFSEFFFPAIGSEVATVGQDLFSTVIKNFEILLKVFFSYDKQYLTFFSYDILGASHYPLLPFWLLPLIFLGTYYFVRQILAEKKIKIAYINLGIWVVVGFILPLFSQVLPDGRYTISAYRLLFTIFPLFFLLAGGLSFIYSKKKILVSLISFIVILTQVAMIYFDHQKSETLIMEAQSPQFLNDIEAGKETDFAKKRFQDFAVPAKVPLIKRHLLFQTYYMGKAKEIFQKIKNQNVPMVTLVNVDFSHLDKVIPAPPMIDHIEKYNYHNLFLSLYLSDLGAEVSYIQVKLFDPIILHRVEFDSEARQFPVKLNVLSQLPYLNPNNLQYIVRKTGAGKVKIFLTTHPVEEALAIKELNAQHTLYRVVH